MVREELISSAVSLCALHPYECGADLAVFLGDMCVLDPPLSRYHYLLKFFLQIVLQDPSVASAAIDKRISFLQSKNLTKEEIDVALARAGEDTSVAAPAGSGHQSAPQQAIYRPPPPPPQQGYGYPPYGQWQPPPE